MKLQNRNDNYRRSQPAKLIVATGKTNCRQTDGRLSASAAS